MRQETPSQDDLQRAIQSYEQVVKRRQARMARKAAPPSPPEPPPVAQLPPPSPPRRSRLIRYEVVAVCITVALGSAGFVLTAPDPDAPVLESLPIVERRDTAVRRVVLDPGHGGRDPGAGTGELREAELVLDVAHRLRERLEAETVIDVVLTRNDDTFVPLDERIAMANAVQADLFLSIHANASRDRLAAGIATYHLSEQANRAPTESARHAHSAGLAKLVQRHMIQRIRRVHPEVRDLGVKQDQLKVLVGAEMPGVLAEVSFLSNDEEAALLSTETYRDRISEALFESIVAYQPPEAPDLASADN